MKVLKGRNEPAPTGLQTTALGPKAEEFAPNKLGEAAHDAQAEQRVKLIFTTAPTTRWRVSVMLSEALLVPGVARARWLLELITVKAGACAEGPPQRSLQWPFSFRSRGPSNVNRVPV